MWIFQWDPLSKIEFMQWKNVDCATFTEICNSTINCRLWQQFFWDTDGLLVADYLHPEKTTIGQYYMQNQHSSYSMSSSRNTDESCHFGVWSFTFHDNAPAQKSLVAQQALCDCEFVQLNHPACSVDLATTDHFLIWNNYELPSLGFFVKPGLQMMNHWWSLSRHGLRLFYYVVYSPRR